MPAKSLRDFAGLPPGGADLLLQIRGVFRMRKTPPHAYYAAQMPSAIARDCRLSG
jgi:hypothetical protein